MGAWVGDGLRTLSGQGEKQTLVVVVVVQLLLLLLLILNSNNDVRTRIAQTTTNWQIF